MAQTPPKKTVQAPKIVSETAKTAAKVANKVVDKAASTALSTIESTRSSAESALNIGSDTIKGLFLNGSEEAQKNHAKVFALGRESADFLTRSVDAFSNTLNDVVAIMRENVDVCVEVGNIVSDIAKTANSEISELINEGFSDNVDVCKEMFACRNINDLFEIQNKWLATNLQNYFNQSERVCEMLFQFTAEISEPLNEHIAETTERLSKSLAA